jgi:hypothetical protein
MAQTKPATNGAAPAAKPQITKMDAVRKAQAALGKNAPAAEVQSFVKDRFGLAMTVDHIHNCRSEIRKQAKKKAGKAKAAAAAAQAKPAAAAPAAHAPAARASGVVSLADLQAAKALLQRVGPEGLRTLIDVLSK